MPAAKSTADAPAKAAKPARKRATTPRAAGARTRTARRRSPSHSEIAERAYFISLEPGAADPFGNWLRAERELAAA